MVDHLDRFFTSDCSDEEKLRRSFGLYKGLLFYRRFAEARAVRKPKYELHIITWIRFVWIKGDVSFPVAIPIHVSDMKLFNYFSNMVSTMTYEGFSLDEKSQKRFDRIVQAKVENEQNSQESFCDTLPKTCRLF